jgi:hypothetical protein
MAGSAALAGRLRKLVQEVGNSIAVPAGRRAMDRVTGWMVLEAAMAGRQDLLGDRRGDGRYWDWALANLVNLFIPA